MCFHLLLMHKKANDRLAQKDKTLDKYAFETWLQTSMLNKHKYSNWNSTCACSSAFWSTHILQNPCTFGLLLVTTITIFYLSIRFTSLLHKKLLFFSLRVCHLVYSKYCCPLWPTSYNPSPMFIVLIVYTG